MEFVEGVAPDVIEARRARNWSMRGLGERDVIARIGDARFVQDWVHGIRQNLIDASSGHHVAAEEYAQRSGLARLHFAFTLRAWSRIGERWNTCANEFIFVALLTVAQFGEIAQPFVGTGRKHESKNSQRFRGCHE